MKTTKNLILSLALIALTASSFGQLSSIKERLFHKQPNKVEYITAEYNTSESRRIENWMYDLRSWSSNRESSDAYVAPVVSSTFTVENIDVVYEEELRLENWMTNSFDCFVSEEDLTIEAWMTTPFEAAEEIEMEDWMVDTFF